MARWFWTLSPATSVSWSPRSLQRCARPPKAKVEHPNRRKCAFATPPTPHNCPRSIRGPVHRAWHGLFRRSSRSQNLFRNGPRPAGLASSAPKNPSVGTGLPVRLGRPSRPVRPKRASAPLPAQDLPNLVQAGQDSGSTTAPHGRLGNRQRDLPQAQPAQPVLAGTRLQ
jgi:hypothetical protein